MRLGQLIDIGKGNCANDNVSIFYALITSVWKHRELVCTLTEHLYNPDKYNSFPLSPADSSYIRHHYCESAIPLTLEAFLSVPNIFGTLLHERVEVGSTPQAASFVKERIVQVNKVNHL